MSNYKNELARRGLFARLPIIGPPDDRIILYRAILDRILLDCFNTDAIIAEDCKTWFSLDNEIFLETCDHADLDIDFVVQYTKKTYNLLKEEQRNKNDKRKK